MGVILAGWLMLVSHWSVSSCRAAEATKLREHFRSVNVALVNELEVIYSAMAIDIWEVTGAAKTKIWFYAVYPGLGTPRIIRI